jgi:hypothetical protein
MAPAQSGAADSLLRVCALDAAVLLDAAFFGAAFFGVARFLDAVRVDAFRAERAFEVVVLGFLAMACPPRSNMIRKTPF